MCQVLSIGSLLGSQELWPLLLALCALPSIAQVLVLPWCPESPRYLLISRGQEAAARRALRALRGVPDTDAAIEEEIDGMRAEHTRELEVEKVSRCA